MKLFDRFIQKVDEGRSGLNTGLPYGFNSLINYIPNIQKSTYYVLGGETGSGKTALADYMFMYSPFNYIMNTETDLKLKILYYSFEIDIESKITKGVAQYIWQRYNILVDLPYILSQGKNRCSDDIYEKCKSAYEYLEQLHDIVEIHDVSQNPTGISKRIEAIALENGVVERVGEYNHKYIPNDPNLHFLVIVDHASLVKGELEAKLTKDRVDLLSEKLFKCRNFYGISPVVVSQFNRSLASAERELSTKQGKPPDHSKIKPQLSDFKNTGNMAEDANVVMSIFSPARYNIPEYLGYNTASIRDRIRFIDILKSRNGSPDLSKAAGYLGECGLFMDFPEPSHPTIRDNSLFNAINSIKKVTD